jgi:hypothetical protein
MTGVRFLYICFVLYINEPDFSFLMFDIFILFAE